MVAFADATQAIFLADLSGDGLTDIVRIRNGEVCYWPNLGYGRFGAKVTMDNSPWFDTPDQFDQKRIRLADIDGSGTTDIIYLDRNGVVSTATSAATAGVDAEDCRASRRLTMSHPSRRSICLATARLAWSGHRLCPAMPRRPMRYIDLMGGQKPHLLIKTMNNLGAETRRAVRTFHQVLSAGQA